MDYQQKFKDIMNTLFKDTQGTFQEFYENGYNDIPQESGIYTVKLPENFPFVFNKDENEIPESCFKKHDEKYLYIGKADNLRKRIQQYVKSVCFKDHKNDNHKGGYPIKFLKNSNNLEISYITIQDMDKDAFFNAINKLSREQLENFNQAQSIETCLTSLHKLAYGYLPFANSEKQNTPKKLISFWENFWQIIEKSSKFGNNTQKTENIFLSFFKSILQIIIDHPKHNDHEQQEQESRQNQQEQNSYNDHPKQNDYNEQQRQNDYLERKRIDKYIEQQRQRQFIEQQRRNQYLEQQRQRKYIEQQRRRRIEFYDNLISQGENEDGTFTLHCAIMCVLLDAYDKGVEYFTPQEIAQSINKNRLYKMPIDAHRVSVRVNKPEYRNLFINDSYGISLKI